MIHKLSFLVLIGLLVGSFQIKAQILCDTIFLNAACVEAEVERININHGGRCSIEDCPGFCCGTSCMMVKSQDPIVLPEEKSSIEIHPKVELNLFPNPSSSFFTIRGNFELGWVRILNASGQIVLFEQVTSQQWTYQHDLAPGTYFVQTKLEPSEVRKLIVTN